MNDVPSTFRSPIETQFRIRFSGTDQTTVAARDLSNHDEQFYFYSRFNEEMNEAGILRIKADIVWVEWIAIASSCRSMEPLWESVVDK